MLYGWSLKPHKLTLCCGVGLVACCLQCVISANDQCNISADTTHVRHISADSNTWAHVTLSSQLIRAVSIIMIIEYLLIVLYKQTVCSLFHSVQCSTTILIQHCVTAPGRMLYMSSHCLPVASAVSLWPYTTAVSLWPYTSPSQEATTASFSSLTLTQILQISSQSQSCTDSRYELILSHTSIVNTSYFHHCCLFLLFTALLLLTTLIFLTAVATIEYGCCHHCQPLLPLSTTAVTTVNHCFH